MTIDEAAESLDKRLRDEPWYTAVGVGKHREKPALFLYVKRLKGVDFSVIKDGWEGYHVEVRKMGSPRALVS
jgi:hypothetical protein